MVNPGGTVTESFISEGEWTPLREAAVGEDGTIPVKVIGPGWSANGNYYSEAMLRRDVPRYRAGTKNYWNHPGPVAEKEHPSGDLGALASKFATAPCYLAEGEEGAFDGPGIYTRARPYSAYRDRIVEMAEDIGMSHRAKAKRRMGEAEGRRGWLVEEITKVISVDYVATPAAGGAVLAEGEDDSVNIAEAGEIIVGTSYEDQIRQVQDALGKRFVYNESRAWAVMTFADRVVFRDPNGDALKMVPYTVASGEITFGEPAPVEQVYRLAEGENNMAELTEAEKKALVSEAATDAAKDAELATLREEVAGLRAEQTTTAAAAVLAEALGAATLPAPAKARLAASLAFAGGEFDADAYRTRITEAIAEEAAYVASITPAPVAEAVAPAAPQVGVAVQEGTDYLALAREFHAKTGGL